MLLTILAATSLATLKDPTRLMSTTCINYIRLFGINDDCNVRTSR